MCDNTTNKVTFPVVSLDFSVTYFEWSVFYALSSHFFPHLPFLNYFRDSLKLASLKITACSFFKGLFVISFILSCFSLCICLSFLPSYFLSVSVFFLNSFCYSFSTFIHSFSITLFLVTLYPQLFTFLLHYFVFSHFVSTVVYIPSPLLCR
jgi:hypothetical protein